MVLLNPILSCDWCSNVLGEFIPFLLLHTPKLKSLGQWLNTMIYGLEILKVGRNYYYLYCKVLQ